MIALTSKYQKYLLIALSYLVSLGSLIIYIIPMAPTLMAQKAENDQLSEKKTQLTKKLNILASVDRETYDRYFLAMNVALPSRKTVDGLLTQIERAAGSEVVLQSFSVTPGEVASPSAAQINESEIPFTFSLMGKKEAIERFLNSIYSLPRLVKVADFTMTLDKLSNLYQSTFNVVTFWDSSLAVELSPTTPIEEINDKDITIINDYVAKNQFVSTQAPYASPSGKTNPFSR